MRASWFLACILPIAGTAQDWNDTLSTRIAMWNAVLAKSDSLSLGRVMDQDWRINTELGEAMAAVLNVPGLSDPAIDSLFPIDRFIHHVRSADGRLRIFQWDERTGGTFYALVHLVFYRDAKGKGHPVFTYKVGDGDYANGMYWSHGGAYGEIHQLSATDSSTLYVCVGGVHGCSTCCSEMLTVLELTEDGIRFDYPAFDLPPGMDGLARKEPTWELTSRCGDITEFAYDPKTRVASYIYTSDDITPVSTEDGQGEKISGRMRFDGWKFVADQ